MNDYGISKVFPTWKPKQIKELLQKLEDYGVDEEDDLKQISIDELVKNCGMKEFHAKKLSNRWNGANTAAGNQGGETKNFGGFGGDNFEKGDKIGDTYQVAGNQEVNKHEYGSGGTVINQSGTATLNAQKANIGSGTQNNYGGLAIPTNIAPFSSHFQNPSKA